MPTYWGLQGHSRRDNGEKWKCSCGDSHWHSFLDTEKGLEYEDFKEHEFDVLCGFTKGYTYKEGPVLEEAKDAVRCIIGGEQQGKEDLFNYFGMGQD